MVKILYFILISLALAILQVSLIPNWSIGGGVVNLPLIAITFWIFTGWHAKRTESEQLIPALILGITIDLLSSAQFLSSTISYFLVTSLLLLLRRLVSFENHLIIMIPIVFTQVVAYDIFFIFLNKIYVFNTRIIQTILLDGVLTALIFALIIVFQRYFKKKFFHHSDIKLIER